MKLGTQALGKGRFERFLLARKHKKSHGKKTLIVALMLTALVDMFSVLVIFLLQTFSASPELMMITKGVTLPVAHTGVSVKDAPLLSVSNEGIFLDQKLIGSVDEVLARPEVLLEKLGELRTNWQRSRPDEAFSGEINLQADAKISSTVVSQIMALLPSEAYSTLQLAIVAGDIK